jgi:hypothetical protein
MKQRIYVCSNGNVHQTLLSDEDFRLHLMSEGYTAKIAELSQKDSQRLMGFSNWKRRDSAAGRRWLSEIRRLVKKHGLLES